MNKEILLLYGTVSGNAEDLADLTSEKLTELGFKTEVKSMDDSEISILQGIKNLLVIVSTWGEGDPPDDCIDFYDSLNSDDAPLLNGLNYSVLSLGDTSYELFCQAGKDIDARLEKLGANRIYERVDCDIDFEDNYEDWAQGVLEVLGT